MWTVPASLDHITPLLAAMDPAELAVFSRISGGAVRAALVRNIRASTQTWCGEIPGGVVTLGGIIPAAPRVGYFWQVTTPALRLHKRAYLLQGRLILARALDEFDRLTTNIRHDYTAALRHMRRFGFNVGAPHGNPLVCTCERGR